MLGKAPRVIELTSTSCARERSNPTRSRGQQHPFCANPTYPSDSSRVSTGIPPSEDLPPTLRNLGLNGHLELAVQVLSPRAYGCSRKLGPKGRGADSSQSIRPVTRGFLSMVMFTSSRSQWATHSGSYFNRPRLSREILMWGRYESRHLL